jgi:hypothetical protein
MYIYIYIYIYRYLAPKKIDPKLLDPASVFADLVLVLLAQHYKY